jgi:mannose-6-phosphate isomerase-like protein (cupin superfamily)
MRTADDGVVAIAKVESTMTAFRKAFGAIAAAAVLVTAAPLRAQDVAAVNPGTIKVTIDNVHVRVMEATLGPGVKEHMHSHPRSVVYVIVGGTVRNHAADGSTSDVSYAAGQTLYREPVTHWAENIGTTTVRLIVVELKDR